MIKGGKGTYNTVQVVAISGNDCNYFANIIERVTQQVARPKIGIEISSDSSYIQLTTLPLVGP